MKAAKRRKIVDVEIPNALDPVLGVSLSSAPAEEVLTLQQVRVWAPALIWYWLGAGCTVHPESQQPVEAVELDAVVRAAVRACSGSPAGPARFLVTSFSGMLGEPEEACPTASSLRDRLVQRNTPMRLAVFLAERLDLIKEAILNECTLDSVRNAHQSLQQLSVTWLWLYDSIWGQLVRLDPALAVHSMMSSALPTFLEALASSYAYHPAALFPIVRHFVFLEEYVCRAALGNSLDEGTWRYEACAQSPNARAQGLVRLGFAEWPLGNRSVITLPQRSTPHHIDFCQAQLDAVPLVQATQAPQAAAPAVAVHTDYSISAQFIHILTHGAVSHIVFNPEEVHEFDNDIDTEDEEDAL